MFVTRPIRCIRISAMHAAAIASAIDTTEMNTTRLSTSVVRAGTCASSSAGPIDGETGNPSVVVAASRSPLAIASLSGTSVRVFKKEYRRLIASRSAGSDLLKQVGQDIATRRGQRLDRGDEALLSCARALARDLFPSRG